MNQLFASLYLDEDVSVLIATLLRSRGFEAVTTVEAKQPAASDDKQLMYAAASQLVLLTHNRAHFERLAEEWRTAGKNHYGIVIAVRRTPYEITRRLLALLDRLTADEFLNQVFYI